MHHNLTGNLIALQSENHHLCHLTSLPLLGEPRGCCWSLWIIRTLPEMLMITLWAGSGLCCPLLACHDSVRRLVRSTDTTQAGCTVSPEISTSCTRDTPTLPTLPPATIMTYELSVTSTASQKHKSCGGDHSSRYM